MAKSYHEPENENIVIALFTTLPESLNQIMPPDIEIIIAKDVIKENQALKSIWNKAKRY